jgi:hypothetical protein
LEPYLFLSFIQRKGGWLIVFLPAMIAKKILTKMVEKYVPQKYNYFSTKDQYIYDTNIIKMHIIKMSGKENKLSSNHTIIERDK